MEVTLLIAGSRKSWRGWLDEHLSGRDLLMLDPAETRFGPAGRVCLVRHNKVVDWRFIGGIDVQRAPHIFLASVAELYQHSTNPVVQLFTFRPLPLHRQTALRVAQMLQPSKIYVETAADLDPEGWPVSVEAISLPGNVPEIVETAQRKARWMELLETGHSHHISLKRVSIQDGRLGSGVPLSAAEREKSGLKDAVWAEVSASTIFVVSDEEPPTQRALDVTHTTKLVWAKPSAYDGLLVSFARQSGEDFDLGLVESVDFAGGEMTVRSPAIPPAPVRILKLGGLRVDPSGNELGETKPWQV